MTPPVTSLDPEARIARLTDDGAFEFLLPRTDCGMVAATGLVKGNKVVVFASDPTIKGGALGIEGSQVIVQRWAPKFPLSESGIQVEPGLVTALPP